MRKETTMWPTSYTFADIELRIAERQREEWEAEFASYGDREIDPELRRHVTADDLPIGEEERDYIDIGEFLAAIGDGFTY
jgi:hypothetical protein